jgi:hypothetical protein
MYVPGQKKGIAPLPLFNGCCKINSSHTYDRLWLYGDGLITCQVCCIPHGIIIIIIIIVSLNHQSCCTIKNVNWLGVLHILTSPSSSSSAYYSSLLDIGLSNFPPSCSIFGYSHPAPTSRLAQIVTPSGIRLRLFHTTWVS